MTVSSFKSRWKQAREAEILAAARDIFVEGGCAGLSLDEVARRTGIAKGTLYAHFAGKDELLSTLLARSVDRWLELVTAAVSPHDDPLQKLRKVAGIMLQAYTSEPELLPAIEARLSCYLRTWGKPVVGLDQVDETIGGFIEEGKASGLIDPKVEARPAAQALRALCSLGVLRQAGDATRVQVAESLLRLYCRGISANPLVGDSD